MEERHNTASNSFNNTISLQFYHIQVLRSQPRNYLTKIVKVSWFYNVSWRSGFHASLALLWHRISGVKDGWRCLIEFSDRCARSRSDFLPSSNTSSS